MKQYNELKKELVYKEIKIKLIALTIASDTPTENPYAIKYTSVLADAPK